jgi:carboxypeptidase PM20D1
MGASKTPWRRWGRRFAALVAALIGLLAVVVLVRALNFRSVQIVVAPVAKIALDEATLATHLAEAIRFRTVSETTEDTPEKRQELARLRAYLEQAFPLLHGKLEHELVSGDSLLFRWPGSDQSLKPILLMGHLDVVPGELPFSAGSGWTHPPFSGDIADGFVWGRGAWDDKSAVMGLMEAVELLLREGFGPRRTVYLAFGHDEEVGGLNGAMRIAALLRQRNVRVDFVLDEGLAITEKIIAGVRDPAALIGITEKGYVTVDLTANGEGGHSSMPPRQTAIGILAAAVERLERNEMAARLPAATQSMLTVLGPEMSFAQRLMLANLWLFRPLVEWTLARNPTTDAGIRTTTAPTIISGGTKDNVLPRSATATVNFRIRPGDSIETVLRHVEKVVADERITIAARPNPMQPAPDAAVGAGGYRTIETTIRQIFPAAVVAPGLTLGATDSRHYLDLADNVYRFSPIRVGPADLARFHGINERVKISDYADAVRFYRQLILNSQ